MTHTEDMKRIAREHGIPLSALPDMADAIATYATDGTLIAYTRPPGRGKPPATLEAWECYDAADNGPGVRK